VFEQAFGRPSDVPEEDEPDNTIDVRSMTREQRNRLLTKLFDDHPALRALVLGIPTPACISRVE